MTERSNEYRSWLETADPDAIESFLDEECGTPAEQAWARRILQHREDLERAIADADGILGADAVLENLRARIRTSEGRGDRRRRSARVRASGRRVGSWAWTGIGGLAASLVLGWVLLQSGDGPSDAGSPESPVVRLHRTSTPATIEPERAGALVLETNNPNIEIIWFLQGEE